MSRRWRLAERSGMGVIVLVLAGGAGSAVAAATVGSAEILDNSLRSRDVKDGTLRLKDLAPGTAAAAQRQRSRGRAPVRPAPGDRARRASRASRPGPGPTSIAETVAFYGPVQSIAPNSQVGVRRPTRDGLHDRRPSRVISTASAALGFAAGKQ